MKSILRKHKVPSSLLAVAAVLVTATIALSLSAHVKAASLRSAGSERLITVHDSGEEKSFLTKATTLKDALKSADIRIDPSDLVEPALKSDLVASNYEINIYRARPVVIVDGSMRQRVMSPYQTAKQIAEQAGMVLHDEDKLTMAMNSNFMQDGSSITLTINRATQFTLKLYGKVTTAYTQGKTVGDMLKEKGIKLAKEDTLTTPESQPIVAGIMVEIWRNGKQTFTQDEPIAPPVRQVQDADQPVGYKNIQTAGKPGKKTVTYEMYMQNGQEVSRTVIQSVVTDQPQEQVEVIGTKMTNTFSGSFADALARLRACEAGGAYSRNSGNGYYGAYQYNISTWAGYGGYVLPSDAPPAV
ncbi:MAG TPA: ubiquitin-like domain-containing protein, partial [Candidatus Saccharimonadales bacterium]